MVKISSQFVEICVRNFGLKFRFTSCSSSFLLLFWLVSACAEQTRHLAGASWHWQALSAGRRRRRSRARSDSSGARRARAEQAGSLLAAHAQPSAGGAKRCWARSTRGRGPVGRLASRPWHTVQEAERREQARRPFGGRQQPKLGKQADSRLLAAARGTIARRAARFSERVQSTF